MNKYAIQIKILKGKKEIYETICIFCNELDDLPAIKNVLTADGVVICFPGEVMHFGLLTSVKA